MLKSRFIHYNALVRKVQSLSLIGLLSLLGTMQLAGQEEEVGGRRLRQHQDTVRI